MSPASWIAILAIAVLSVICAFVGSHLGRSQHRRVSAIAALGAVLLLLLHGMWLQDNRQLVRLLPVADVLIWSHIQPLAAGLLAGIAWTRLRTPRWQRIVLVVPLVSIAAWRAWSPALVAMPQLGAPKVQGPLVRQTSKSSCSAAAAATALRQCGIDATEEEMARLCFTGAGGTTNLGLYRGLKLKTAGTPIDVEVCDVGNTFGPEFDHAPVIIDIGLKGADAGPWFLMPVSVSHSVVIVGRSLSGDILIADPQSGMQTWPIKQLTDRWTGSGFRLHNRLQKATR